MILSDLLQNINLTLQDVSFIREMFHELLISAMKYGHTHLNISMTITKSVSQLFTVVLPNRLLFFTLLSTTC